MTNSSKASPAGGLPYLLRAKSIGRIGGIFFVLALFCIIDSVQSIIRIPFNAVEIVAGKNVSVTGILPHEVEDAEDMEFFLEGSGARGLSFSPTAAFRGFWLGGNMWRGTLFAKPDADTGEATLTIVDLVPAKRVQKDGEEVVPDTEEPTLIQNPGLVFSVKVWHTKKEANQASHSIIRRTAGISAPLLSVAILLLGFGTGTLSFLTMRKAEAILTREKVFIIHGSKPLRHGLAVYFTIPRGMVLSTTETPNASLCRPDGEIIAEGNFTEIAKGKGTVLFSGETQTPAFGWLIILH